MPTRKSKSKSRKSKRKTQGSKLKSRISKRETQDIIPKPNKSSQEVKDYGKKISQFVLKNRDKLQAHFLKTVCSKSGDCISFGKEIDKITNFFDFNSFKYLDKDEYNVPVNILDSGENGFITSIEYNREGYKAHTILKSSLKENSDNLVYEYLVGKQINKWMKLYPCFLETYGVYRYNNEDTWSKFLNGFNTPSAEITRLLLDKTKLIEMNDNDGSFIDDSCHYSKYISILIQHLQNPFTLKNFMTGDNVDLLYILFQVYMPLKYLQDYFTHYDLHYENVLVFIPDYDSYIQYHYHLSNGKTTSFKSRFLVKIIDYGRAYFQDDKHPKNNSLTIYNKVCASKSCIDENYPKKCGMTKGYTSFNYVGEGENDLENGGYIDSQKANRSHDLRLLAIIDYMQKKYRTKGLKELLENVIYEKNVMGGPNHGTEERKSTKTDDKIYNVDDAFVRLNELINDPENFEMNEEAYSGMKKIGDLHVYTDGKPTEFINSER